MKFGEMTSSDGSQTSNFEELEFSMKKHSLTSKKNSHHSNILVEEWPGFERLSTVSSIIYPTVPTLISNATQSKEQYTIERQIKFDLDFEMRLTTCTIGRID